VYPIIPFILIMNPFNHLETDPLANASPVVRKMIENARMNLCHKCGLSSIAKKRNDGLCEACYYEIQRYQQEMRKYQLRQLAEQYYQHFGRTVDNFNDFKVFLQHLHVKKTNGVQVYAILDNNNQK